uniref:inositol-polyphosphate 5-phosphatase n=1 Tax=Glossina brevipalpis TaxID=37001 RepID=A0A1A9W6N5_9MUSC
METSSVCWSADSGDCGINIILVTANVGSLFEDPSRLLRPWLVAFLKKVSDLQMQFLALHLQEVGGKTYEKSMEYVQEFIKCLCEAPELKDFEYIRIYMDEDFRSAEHFTALGNLYFVHKNLTNVRIWNFLTHAWESAEGKNIYSGNIETISSKEKAKFPQHFFPECKWSRKGFMRTRWEVNNTVFDLVNIHLFHDASNLAACEEFPSVYCKTRRRALVHTLERFHLDDKNGLAPFFVFGDFNFRCDTEGVIKELTENLTAHRVHGLQNDCTKVHYRNSMGDNILTVGKKEFNHADHQLKFKEIWLKKFDRELEPLREFLEEFPIDFPPSYPYEEDPEMPMDYMSTRCPSWCDRILMSPQAKQIIDEKFSPNIYNIIGENVCMGDHKPIYLNIRLKPNQGTYRCCNCNISNANNNKSTSHNNPAVTVVSSSDQQLYNDDAIFCPYNSTVFIHQLTEYNRFNEMSVRSTKPDNQFDLHSVIANTNNEFSEIQNLLRDGRLSTSKWPPISINIIDSDNIHVCMCSQILGNDTVDGTICPECQNIIKKQPIEHRCRLISKRLLLSNNIIVNRIDTQHLNTYLDRSSNGQDPYTPESAESHSPLPELSSSTTTTASSNSRSLHTDGRIAIDKNTNSYDSSLLHNVATMNVNVPNKQKSVELSMCKSNDAVDEKQHRGIVSPGQLKLRLEDLQKKTLSQNVETHRNSGGTAGNGDVEDVDEICQANAATETHHTDSCLPRCCNIN